MLYLGMMKDLNKNSTSIKNWAADDRPREKLLNQGAAMLSNSELLAILIGMGRPGRSAVELARELLQLAQDNLSQMGQLSVTELMRVNGIGQAKAITISAALELGRRRQASKFLEQPVLKKSGDIAAYIHALLRDEQREIFAVLMLNQAGRLIHTEIISEGSITTTVADPKMIMKRSLERNAVSIVLCHNHPSGSLRPSSDDIELTRKIFNATKFMDIRLLDHVIVGPRGYFSFADQSML